ncbi:hypothetical protein BX616_003833 [Lobosporangium transversale]|uniref:Cytosol aminopeptidase domain-containing protein n=1 Tax=Lobosporangium transversale TaxID=64571 RepID=A0A1Y2GZC1_9FUNG|nr:hypothetical protein BCR41DRAFT_345614 [Lobosporangium transversale]KAF9898597.1 hypothetical protein BX616_003833 [Lobosporangium transversale]ORZ27625.1 hypothetical protein BCR41DRAFT_345614 [Lobosporangium transversale]|eukprot:XP_021885328.1 hypothetical protein BCR41DRAFT_345614 [Lobosporangium transversale]
MTLALPAIVSASSADLTSSGSGSQFDAVIAVYPKVSQDLLSDLSLNAYSAIDKDFGSSLTVVPDPNVAGGRLILAPTGSLNGDSDDVRKFQETTKAAMKRAQAAGAVAPLIYFPYKIDGDDAEGDYVKYIEVSLLGALSAVFDPIDVREHYEKIGKSQYTIQKIGVLSSTSSELTDERIQFVSAIELGRRVAKDLGSPNCERMTPIKFTEYVECYFKPKSDIKLTVVEDINVIQKEYPLLHAVSRCSLSVPRHFPRVVKLEYKSAEPSMVKENLYFVGKGVTYDTGGADIKAGGIMRGMSRDKCGAAAVAGFMATVAELKPKHVNVTAILGLVRNSVGSNAYVSDEVLYSRAGLRVLVGNTDAEGRMVMTDPLCECKELVLANRKDGINIPSRLFTVATLTGHAIRAYGPYGICLDNGPARKANISPRIQAGGHILGDPFEISTLRREDYAYVMPGSSAEDVVQANDKSSSDTPRGHQYPMAFMSVASGLCEFGLDKEKRDQIAYTHVDIAASAEQLSGVGFSLPEVTGNPVPSFAAAFLL